MMRGAHYILGWDLKAWMLLFVDDGKILMPLGLFRKIAPVLFAFFCIFGFSIKWPKVRGGL